MCNLSVIVLQLVQVVCVEIKASMYVEFSEQLLSMLLRINCCGVDHVVLSYWNLQIFSFFDRFDFHF